MAGAALLTWSEKRWPEVQEALIGVLFVLAASGGMMLVANNPHGGEHLQDLLSGQILWVGYRQLLPVLALNSAILVIWFWRNRQMGRFGFYGLFAFAVTASVQLVGVYLVFASLIVPALASRGYSSTHRLRVAYGMGALAYALGLALSTQFDLPSGPAVVCALALLGILAQAVRKECA